MAFPPQRVCHSTETRPRWWLVAYGCHDLYWFAAWPLWPCTVTISPSGCAGVVDSTAIVCVTGSRTVLGPAAAAVVRAEPCDAAHPAARTARAAKPATA